MKKRVEVQSLQRAIAILRTFTAENPELGVTEISQRVELHKSTTHRLLSTLVAEGLLSQNPETGHYRLGVELIVLGGRVSAYTDLRQVARRHMRFLAEKASVTISLAVLGEGASVNLEQAIPRERNVVDYNWIGRRLPAHAASTSKVLLAWLEPEEMITLLKQPLEAYTPHTITDIEALRVELDTIRRIGYAVEREEYEIGLNAIAAPVRNHTDQVVAALCASGPSYCLPAENFEEIAQAVISLAQTISAELGYVVK